MPYRTARLYHRPAMQVWNGLEGRPPSAHSNENSKPAIIPHTQFAGLECLPWGDPSLRPHDQQTCNYARHHFWSRVQQCDQGLPSLEKNFGQPTCLSFARELLHDLVRWSLPVTCRAEYLPVFSTSISTSGSADPSCARRSGARS